VQQAEGIAPDSHRDVSRSTQRVELTKDRAYFSQEVQDLLAADEASAEEGQTLADDEASVVAVEQGAENEADDNAVENADESSEPRRSVSEDPNQLTEQEERVVHDLQQRDREVRSTSRRTFQPPVVWPRAAFNTHSSVAPTVTPTR
jgi:DNA-directed RNA polymerase specialized sigma subunit